MFSSDNGAAEHFGGSNLPLSGFKGSTMEGGMRVPCIMRWPTIIPAGKVCNEMASTLEVLPTISGLVSYQLTKDIIIDGKDMYALMTNPEARSPRKVLYNYQLEQLQAIRSGDWKLLLPLDSMYVNIHAGTFGKGRKLQLINLKNDIREERDVSDKYPRIVARLMKYAKEARKDLGDLYTEGIHTRKAGIVEHPIPQLLKLKR